MGLIRLKDVCIPNKTQLVFYFGVLLSAHLILLLFGKDVPYSFYYANNVPKLLSWAERRSAEASSALFEIQKHLNGSKLFSYVGSKETPQDYCIAIMTIPRPGQTYLSQTAAALLTRIPWSEQYRVSITIIDATHSSDEDHSTEVENLSQILTIKKLDDFRKSEEKGRDLSRGVVKEVLDYILALRMLNGMHCRYSIVLEDDAIVAIDFLHKLDALLENLNKLPNDSWLLLKLWSSFRYIGWSKDCPFDKLLIACCTATLIATYLVLLILFFLVWEALFSKRNNRTWDADFQLRPSSKMSRKRSCPLQRIVDLFSPNFTSFLALCIGFSTLVLLIGKQNLPPLRNGIHRVSTGAGAVALLYPSHSLAPIVSYLQSSYEQHAREKRLEELPNKDLFFRKISSHLEKEKSVKPEELVCIPTLFQHIGFQTSLLKWSSVENVDTSQSFPDDGKPIVFKPPSL